MTGFGYIEDALDNRDVVFGSASSRLTPGDLMPFVRGIFAQGSTSSCVANGLAAAIAVRDVRRGRGWDPSSRRFIYYYARQKLGELGRDGDGELLDAGCRIRDALKVVSKLGAPDEEDWPFLVDKLNERPPWLIRRKAIDRGFSYQRVWGIDGVRGALARGFPVVAGFFVDRAFIDGAGPTFVESFNTDDIAGGHLMMLARDIRGAQESITAVNSWDTVWRNRGTCELSPFIIEHQMRDAWAIC